MAWSIVGMLIARDPLSENVRLGKLGMLRATLTGVAGGLLARMVRRAVAANASRRA